MSDKGGQATDGSGACALHIGYLRLQIHITVAAVLLGDQQHCCHHAPTVKPEAATEVVVAPDDGRKDAQNMLSCTYE
jgi:hypothetical protein